MQLARQSTFKNEKPARSKKDVRAATIAAIHVTWKKLRRDLKGDADELREQRLAFMSRVLNCEVKSTRDLTPAKLGKVLDAMRELERAPTLPGVSSLKSQVPSKEPETWDLRPETAEIVHLATEAQVATIEKLFKHLGWGLEAIEGFTEKRFKVKSYRMLTPAKANSLTMILLNIAASNALRKRGMQRVSRRMIAIEIPSIKRLLNIDQKPSPPTHGYEDEDLQHDNEEAF
ncbi:MAG TPA: phage protein GemA/Gp16 family protein [Pyrinomonadaceae bacterium]|nr:phage protein GemA/Gp16 family protein [Pyrinomonadaceae bacterium]